MAKLKDMSEGNTGDPRLPAGLRRRPALGSVLSAGGAVPLTAPRIWTL